MKLRQSAVLRRRWRRPELKTTILRPGDPDYERTKLYAISEPLFDAVTTRIRFTPPEELKNLIGGLAEEVHRRFVGG